ncbi:hypothetical protein KIH41_01290 [Litoribacter ruber]|uniref:hypothetical protein n=1 Tax=Litoribacter ruber TaxID=702568 RepID=UPI001BDB13F5|nr:hypothetical protein [Litoribacter ruber]MBT0809909.1 hypothetical protein [Litoribacter ruber]
MTRIFTLAIFCVLLVCQSCSQSETLGHSEISEVSLELLDSLVVDVLDPLEMDDYHEEKGLYLMRGKSRKIYLVNEEGEVLQEPDIIGNGPDQVGGRAVGCQFLGDDRIVCMDASSKFHIYDSEFKNKINVLASPMKGLNTLVINNYRLNFRTAAANEKPSIFGVEINSFSYSDINPTELKEDFYKKAKVAFQYAVEEEELEFLESYPDQWMPKREGVYVGESYPLSDFNRSTMEYALLHGVGDQLFVYEGLGSNSLKYAIDLRHPERAPLQEWITDGFNDQFGSYPRFNDLRMFGDYQIVKFNTQVPASVHRELKAGNENYGVSPEWREALEKYFRPYYILAKAGKQVGIINNFPVPGHMDYVSSDGVVYLNDNRKPSVERDYNVFYKVKIRE